MAEIIINVDCDPEAILVARALYAHNSYPGRKATEIPWPPKTRSALMHYIKLGQAVIEAQRAALGQSEPEKS